MKKDAESLPFKMLIEACPMPAFYLKASSGQGEANSKFKQLYLHCNLKAIASSVDLNGIVRPMFLKTTLKETSLNLVAIPLSYGVQREEIIFLNMGELIDNELIASQELLFEDESWHELNNPIAIIAMTLARARKVRYLDQNHVDGLIDKTSRNFARIQKYLLSQLT